MLADNIFLRQFGFNERQRSEFLKLFKEIKYSKDTLILQPPKIERSIKFVNSGYLRTFLPTPTHERNINFHTQGNFVIDIVSFQHNIPSKQYQQTLSDTSLLVLDKNDLEKFLNHNDIGTNLIHSVFESTLSCLEEKQREAISLTTEEHYLHLIDKHPEWIKFIPQYHLASFLGVSPETLSRIRKRIS